MTVEKSHFCSASGICTLSVTVLWIIFKMSKMKFGLNTSLKKNKSSMSIKPKAFFQDDEDDEDHKTETKETKDSHKNRINKQLTGYTSMSNKKIEEQHKQALEEDPNIFDYDAVYDDLKTAEKQKVEQLKGKDNKKVKQWHVCETCLVKADKTNVIYGTRHVMWKGC
jgi:hypothetical protein